MASSARLSVALGTLLLTGSGEASAAQLTASWDDNSSGVATTRVERRLGSDTVFAGIADVPPGVTSYADTLVSAGTTYCYRALAWDTDGVSPYSNEACATTSGAGTQLSVSVSKAGTGAGTVASSPAGIDCGSACAAGYIAGTSVTLTATAASGSTFTGWTGGACAGTAPCTLVGNAPVTLTASFSLAPSILAASPTTGPSGTEFTVTLSNWSGSAFDWLTIVPAGAANTTYGAWIYVRSVPGTGSTKTWRVTLSTPGAYEARLLLNNGFARAATSGAVTVAGVTASPSPSPSPSPAPVPSLGVASGLSVSPATGPTGTEFIVSLSDWSGGAFDWLTIVPTGAASTTYGAWSYVGSVPGTGSAKTWRVTLSTPGTFEARLLLNNGYARVATSAAFTVAGSSPSLGVASGLSVSPATGAAGTEFIVTLTDWSGGAFDWLTIAPVGAANTTYGKWLYVRSVPGTGSTKTWRVTLSTPGTFEARLLLNNGYTGAATSPAFTVTGASVAVVAP